MSAGPEVSSVKVSNVRKGPLWGKDWSKKTWAAKKAKGQECESTDARMAVSSSLTLTEAPIFMCRGRRQGHPNRTRLR